MKSKEELEKLAQQIRQDQAKANPAEKRVKVNTSFNKAVKKNESNAPAQKGGKLDLLLLMVTSSI